MSRALQNEPELSAAEKRALLADLLRQKAARARTLPTSFAQQRLWFLGQLEPDSAAYNIPRAQRMQGELNVPALRQTFNTIVARHDVLRGSFDLVDGHPVQLIAPRLEIDLPIVDLEGLPENERQPEVTRLANAEAQQPFDLTKAPLFRVCLLKLGHQDHVLLLTTHHIVSDGWSMVLFAKEMAAIYQAISEQRPVDLPEPSIQYADFAAWQRRWLQGEVLEEQLRYWKQHLAGAPAVLNLPIANQRQSMQTFRSGHLTRTLSQELSAALVELSRREGATLFMTLLAAFQTLLYRYSGQEDLVVGTPIAGRNRAETEDLIGFFVNTLPLRTNFAGAPSFRELLRRVRETALGAYAHQDLPFERIVEELQPERSLSHTPLFQVMFALQNQPQADLNLPGLNIKVLERETDSSKFDLTLSVRETASGLVCWLEYGADLFAQSTIERLLEHFEVLLGSVVADMDRRLAELPLLTERERQQLLVEWNDTRVEFPAQYCLHQLFEAQAEKTPNAIALVCGAEQLTYQELNARANQLASYLQRLGVGPEDRVGICLNRSPAMLIAVLGTLKAGGAYVPLDPAYPQERLAFTLTDAAAAVLLTEEALLPILPRTDTRVVCLNSDWAIIGREDQSNPTGLLEPRNLAYVIYTSGSTGQPKGVAIEHASAVALLHWAISSFDPKDLAGVLASTSLCFDLSVFELFAPLCTGGKVILVEDVLRLAALIPEEVTLVNTVPSAMAELVRLRGIPPSVTTINLAGEPLANSLVQEIYEQDNVLQVFNLYGPSEDTTYSTFVRLAKGATTEPSIGRPISNTEVYLLDSFFQPVPIGVPGELHLGGAGLARGYLHRGALTAEKFVPHPFSQEPGARLYKTGDLARYWPDGTIQFLGRLDHQVKLRGYRIELGEIQAALREHAAVQDAVVMVRPSAQGNKDLVGYVVADPNHSAFHDHSLARDLQGLLKKKLPDYMVPAYFVFLEQLPLTPNGKIDRRALQVPERARPEPAQSRPAPRDELESKLARIWEKILELTPVGINDNFFELGGHSLLAVRLVAEIEKEFGQKIPLVSLFRSATVAGLAEILRQGVASTSWPTLVEIQRGVSKPPLFCVSNPNVNALGYLSLARHLGSDQPVYGLQAQYPQDLKGEHSQAAVDELATEYVKALRTVQPDGPYQLIGFCRGAHIAFEIARRLEAEGQQTALLGILDTWVMENTYNNLWYFEYYARRLVSRQRLGIKKLLSFIRRKALGTVTNPDDEKSASALEEFTKRKRDPRLEAYSPGPDFVPKTYSGCVTVFRTRRQPLNRIRDRMLGWSELAGGVEVHFVPGEHDNVLKEPHVQGLAKELKKCLLADAPF